MITSLFRKSTPLNYTVVIVALVIFFFLYQIGQAEQVRSFGDYFLKFSVLAFVFASLFMANFIVKKNGLSKDSAYTVLFYLVFVLFFPSTLDNLRLVMANFFILLSMRRLVSLHSVKATKEKIFDASLWIFLAAMFHFWCVLFIILVFISILFHAARDYRNWFLPIIAFFTALTIFVLFALLIEKSWIADLFAGMAFDFKVNYFTSNFQNAALSVYATIAVFFLASLLMSLSNRPLILHSSYQKIIWYFALAALVFLVSPHKSNDLLVFTFAPLAIMATSHIEWVPIQWQKELILFAVMGCGVVSFFLQL
ncbi:DUF6427 family protein [Flavobacterium caeni]|uniref:EpsG family protein n=1 Tax=Flavobacterium caeni TaxID=490189 RepID=A0A1G5JA96_9FLAO|nr:DUF6427 family protein [Flavobacterium caeni]SCY85296.1 hypothetical protein SAMN02927903_02595 [Flavobacterium caeni]